MSAASTSAAGSIQVEVQDEQRRPLDGFALADMAPWYGDALDAPVAWKEGGDLGRLAGRQDMEAKLGLQRAKPLRRG